jgi:DNA-binding NtrC family response regulator
MNKRKNHFSVVRFADIAPLLLIPARPQILSVTQDPSLAKTREMLLASAGFQVSSFLNAVDAIAACRAGSFDLLVVGHSIPLAARRALVKEMRRLCPAPILALVRPGEAPLDEADYSFDSSESPALLLETVEEILHRKVKNA